MRIGTKMALLGGAATLLAGGAGVLAVWLASLVVERQVVEKFEAVSTYTMDKVHRLFARRSDDMAALAADPALEATPLPLDAVAAKLGDYLRRYPNYAPYTSLSLFDLQRRRLADTTGRGIGETHTLSEYWPEVMAGHDRVLQVSTSESLGQPVFHVAQVVRDPQRRAAGVLVARIAVASLRDVIGRPLRLFAVDGPFEVDLLDRTGLVLYANHDQERTLRQRHPLHTTIANLVASGPRTGALVVPQAAAEGDRLVIYAREPSEGTEPSGDWTLVISIPEAVALADINALRRQLLALVAAVGLLAIALAWLLARNLLRPIDALGAATAAVAAGDLSVQVAVNGKGDFALLAQRFNAMVADLRELHGGLERAATTDRLTGLLNRHGFDDMLTRELDRAKRYGSQLSLIFIDIDHFKSINDRFGHAAGDQVLAEVARLLQGSVRSTDGLGRWGGEEFVILTPETSLRDAAALAERICQTCRSADFANVGRTTLSAGVVSLAPGEAGDALLRRADAAVYAAKANGRDRVEIDAEPGCRS